MPTNHPRHRNSRWKWMTSSHSVSTNAHVRSCEQILDQLNVSQLPSSPISTSARGSGLDRVSCRRCHRPHLQRENKHRITENTIFREINVILEGVEHLFSVFVFDMLILSCVAHILLSLVSLYLDRVSAYTHRTMNMKAVFYIYIFESLLICLMFFNILHPFM